MTAEAASLLLNLQHTTLIADSVLSGAWGIGDGGTAGIF
jgi:hypothetical protein